MIAAAMSFKPGSPSMAWSAAVPDAVLWRARDRGRGQDVQVGDIREHVQDRHGQHARPHGHREVALGVLELASAKPTLFHASIENSEPTMAAPMVPRPTAAPPVAQEVAAEVGGQRLGVAADGDAEQDQQRERTGLDGVRDVWIRAAVRTRGR